MRDKKMLSSTNAYTYLHSRTANNIIYLFIIEFPHVFASLILNPHRIKPLYTYTDDFQTSLALIREISKNQIRDCWPSANKSTLVIIQQV